jgi:hypothetical protein
LGLALLDSTTLLTELPTVLVIIERSTPQLNYLDEQLD